MWSQHFGYIILPTPNYFHDLRLNPGTTAIRMPSHRQMVQCLEEYSIVKNYEWLSKLFTSEILLLEYAFLKFFIYNLKTLCNYFQS